MSDLEDAVVRSRRVQAGDGRSDLELWFARMVQAAGLPAPEAEWHFDWCCPHPASEHVAEDTPRGDGGVWMAHCGALLRPRSRAGELVGRLCAARLLARPELALRLRLARAAAGGGAGGRDVRRRAAHARRWLPGGPREVQRGDAGGLAPAALHGGAPGERLRPRVRGAGAGEARVRRLSPAGEWAERATALSRKRVLHGFATLCPRCWRPYPERPRSRKHTLTGRPPCRCADRVVVDGLMDRELLRVHGLEAIEPMIREAPVRREGRAD